MIVDGHEDLALNALSDGRSYLTSAREIRRAETGTGIEEVNGIAMLGLADWLEGGVGVIVATVTVIPRAFANHGDLSYATQEGAHEQALAQFDLYRRWERDCPQLSVVRDKAQLDEVVTTWTDGRAVEDRRIGLVLLMENADPIRDPSELYDWYELGLRLIGPAWHANRYSGDTRAGGPLTADGRRLLREMERLGLVLDLTHMSEEACLEAIDSFGGGMVATHAHSRRTVPLDRLLSDAVIDGIVRRDGVVGVMPLNWALREGWRRGDGKEHVTLDDVVGAIDAVCELAGNARHVAIGTDFDGGQGAESAPAEIDTIGDLPKLAGALSARGYAPSDIQAIMGGNWLRLLRARLQ